MLNLITRFIKTKFVNINIFTIFLLPIWICFFYIMQHIKIVKSWYFKRIILTDIGFIYPSYLVQVCLANYFENRKNKLMKLPILNTGHSKKHIFWSKKKLSVCLCVCLSNYKRSISRRNWEKDLKFSVKFLCNEQKPIKYQ